MTHARNQSKSDLHSGPQFRPNGHAPVSPSHAVRPNHAPDGAASDDARESPNAAAVPPTAAGTERAKYAEVAPSAEGERRNRKGKKGHAAAPPNCGTNKEKPDVHIPPGTRPLPPDGPGFVDAMHEHVDLYLACARLVSCGDVRIAQRMVERLLEMKFGKPPSAAEENQDFVIDVDSAVARRAALGAKE